MTKEQRRARRDIMAEKPHPKKRETQPPKRVWYSCPSCPVDEDQPGSCGVCGRTLVARS